MLDIDFYPADLTPRQQGPGWFDATSVDVPLYFSRTNSQLSGNLSDDLSDFAYSSPSLGRFRIGYTDFYVCQRVPLYRARHFLLLRKKEDGQIFQATQLSDFLRNLLQFWDEHPLLQEALFEIKKKHQLKTLFPVGYVILESYYWH